MIRRSLRLGIRLGLLAGIAFALLKLVQSRREASEFGSPSSDWAPAPAPNTNLPRTPPEPDLVQPAMLEEVLSTRPLERSAPADDAAAPPAGSAARTEQAPETVAAVVEPFKKAVPVKKAPPAKRAAAKKAEGEPAKKATAKKATAKKAAAAKKAPAAKKSDADPEKQATKKATQAKKAAKKQQP